MISCNWIKDTIDCRDLAAHYLGQPARLAGRAWQWYCPFHADRQTPSLTVYRNGYRCFGCGASGDAVGLVMTMELMDFPTAVEHLDVTAAALPAAERRQAAGRVQRQRANLRVWRQASWQAGTWRLVQGTARGLASAQGEPGRAYLAGRGLQPATWQAWSLGYAPCLRRWRSGPEGGYCEVLGPAITLPWTDGQRVKALQYRLIDHPSMRYWQRTGGERTLFGVQCLAQPCGRRGGRPALVLVEGELNAISVWQAASAWVDVVSFGPQGNIGRVAGLMRRLAARYDQVVVWADQMGVALDALDAVGRRGIALRSPNGLDANDLLVAGQLQAFLCRVLERGEDGTRVGAAAPGRNGHGR